MKIRGFRIELGEIESVVLKHSQIIQTAVIDWSDAQNNRQLVAYVVLDELADKEAFGQALQTTSELFRELRSHLKTSLPDYMLPAIFVPLGSLPLLPNGKISRRALPAPIFKEALKVKESVLTTTEQALVNVWQGLLNQPVGIHDNFFELGGDSILAIQAIAQAQKVGLYFSPRDLFQYATISQLAGIATTQPHSQAQQSSIVGAVPLTPIQHWFFQQTLEAPHHWNQSILLTVKQPLRSDILEQALRQLMHHHDALRATFQKTGQETEQGWQQIYGAPSDKVPLKVVQGRVENATHVITAEAEAIQSSFELESGPLLKVVYYDLETSAGAERRLLIVCHHLIIDGVSWRILLSDLQFLYQQLSQSVNQSDSPPDNLQLPPKTLSFQVWSQQLSATDFTAELP
ncbi:MAG: condensation domain-containing protein, partial [Cyanobacteria bacterium J06576_12]